MQDHIELPPLPTINPMFTEAQIQAYARVAILADRASQAAAPVEVSRLAERPDDMLTVAHIEPDGGGATLILGGDQLGDFIDMVGEDEETYTVRIAGMTRAEFEALGEFDGF